MFVYFVRNHWFLWNLQFELKAWVWHMCPNFWLVWRIYMIVLKSKFYFYKNFLIAVLFFVSLNKLYIIPILVSFQIQQVFLKMVATCITESSSSSTASYHYLLHQQLKIHTIYIHLIKGESVSLSLPFSSSLSLSLFFLLIFWNAQEGMYVYLWLLSFFTVKMCIHVHVCCYIFSMTCWRFTLYS